jgi:hypothetical protein
MPRSLEPDQKKLHSSSFLQFYQPVGNITPKIPVLESRGDRPLKMTFDARARVSLQRFGSHSGVALSLTIASNMGSLFRVNLPIHLS